MSTEQPRPSSESLGAPVVVLPQESVKIAEHEEAAHEKRNWVRLTFDCNNHCVFCLDTLTHDGVMRDKDDVKKQILEGKKAGAERLILSGGEPTMHPNYIDFIKLGKLAGYRKIQTVTNGRKFMYPDFLQRCLDAGLDEITFSLHGPNAKVHDALVGVKGAFEQETAGLKNALAHQQRSPEAKPIVNVDIVINRGNVKHLNAMLTLFHSWGVREFDLLQVIPFGNAFKEGKDILFYDLEELRPYLLEAFEWTKKPDVHIWLNRFPPPHLEGYEHLIQDPYKLNDEVKGRKEEFAKLLEEGLDLDCRDPFRCSHCYLQRLCDTLYGVRDMVAKEDFAAARVDTEWEKKQDKVFGGDPASAKRALQGDNPAEVKAGRLPVIGSTRQHPLLPRYPSAAELVAHSGAKRLHLVAPEIFRAMEELQKHPKVTELELELGSYDGLERLLADGGLLAGKRVVAAVAGSAAQATQLLAMPHPFEVVVLLTRETAEWLRAQSATGRIAIRQPTYERLTESAERDVDLRAFFSEFTAQVPVEGVPACVTGRPERARPRTLDAAMMTPEGRLEIFRYAKRYIVAHYKSKALRCKTCVHNASCDGMHINYVRAHGYGLMQPVVREGAAMPAAPVTAEGSALPDVA